MSGIKNCLETSWNETTFSDKGIVGAGRAYTAEREWGGGEGRVLFTEFFTRRQMANEDTLLLIMFLGRASRETFVVDTNCS